MKQEISKGYYPVDSRGNMMARHEQYSHTEADSEKPIEVFSAEMTFIEAIYCSSCEIKIVLKDQKGKTWQLWGRSIGAFITHASKGVLKGQWMVRKHGNYYGLDLVDLG